MLHLGCIKWCVNQLHTLIGDNIMNSLLWNPLDTWMCRRSFKSCRVSSWDSRLLNPLFQLGLVGIGEHWRPTHNFKLVLCKPCLGYFCIASKRIVLLRGAITEICFHPDRCVVMQTVSYTSGSFSCLLDRTTPASPHSPCALLTLDPAAGQRLTFRRHWPMVRWETSHNAVALEMFWASYRTIAILLTVSGFPVSNTLVLRIKCLLDL